MKAALNYILGTPSVRTPYKGVALGNSIVAAYNETNSITHYLFTEDDYAFGYDIYNQAVPGNTIGQQQVIFEADTNKSTYDFAIIQVGVNNLANSNSIGDIISEYQGLVDSIKTNGKAGVKVILSTMTPCKQRLDEISYSYTNWLLLNEAIRGAGSTPITNVDGVCSIHTVLMNDGSGNLKFMYEGAANDHIHPNNAAKQLIAVQSWRPGLQAAGLYTP